MKRQFLLLIATSLILSSLALAENGGRGGGNAIVCVGPQGQVPREILDYYEASLTTNLKIDLGPDTGTYQDRVNYVLNRLAKVDPALAIRYREKLATFESEAKFIPADQLRAIADSNEPVKPEPGCNKEQFAVQKFNLRPNELRYLINNDVWSTADRKVKAGLVLHELIYRDMVEVGKATNSDSARYFNAQISSTRMDTISYAEYYQLLSEANLTDSDDLFSEFKDGLPVYIRSKNSQYSNYVSPIISEVPLPYLRNGITWMLSPFSSADFREGRLYTAEMNLRVSIEGQSYSLGNVRVTLSNGAEDFSSDEHFPVLADRQGNYPSAQMGGQTFKHLTGLHTKSWDGNHTVAPYIVGISLGADPAGQSIHILGQEVTLKNPATLEFNDAKEITSIQLEKKNVADPTPAFTFNLAGTLAEVSAVYFNPDKTGDYVTVILSAPLTLNVNGHPIHFVTGTRLSMYMNGVVAAFYAKGFSQAISAQDQTLTTQGGATYYPSGKIECFKPNSVAHFLAGDLSITVGESSNPDFIGWTCLYENGSLKSGTVITAVPMTLDGKSVTLQTGWSLFYDFGGLAVGQISPSTRSLKKRCDSAGLEPNPLLKIAWVISTTRAALVKDAP